jgi:hypothetical protein
MRASSMLTFAIALSTPLAAACVAAPDDTSALTIPLVQNGGDGNVYRLSASFELTAPDGTVTVLDGNVDAPSLTLALAPATYTVHLADGWTLSRSTDGTTFTPVTALLGSQNPQAVHIFPDSAASASFRFFVRDPQGSLSIGFGVVGSPQQIFGTLSFASAGGVLADYAGKAVDYSTYFDPAAQATEIAADGSKVRHYHAVGVATEFLHDPIGLFAGPLTQAGAGGTLDMTIRVRADGTQELNGASANVVGAAIAFGPATVAVPVDAAGFPVDAPFAVTTPFTVTGSPTSTGAGTATLTHELD